MKQHGIPSTYNSGCRCQECTTCNRERARRLRADLRARPRDQVPHGTAGGYVNWSCRCKACYQAHALEHNALLASLRTRPDPPHGTRSGYQAWGCRCMACYEAMRDYRRDYQQARKAARGQ